MLLAFKQQVTLETLFLWDDTLNLYLCMVFHEDAITVLIIRGNPEVLNFEITSN